jgi:hypothetical protein
LAMLIKQRESGEVSSICGARSGQGHRLVKVAIWPQYPPVRYQIAQALRVSVRLRRLECNRACYRFTCMEGRDAILGTGYGGTQAKDAPLVD